jgi:predicted DCC family thiol-disulfide oxidoreductase YuxK
MDAQYPLTLFYDGQCAVCSLEMDHLRERNHDGRLLFVDMAAEGFDPAPFGATHAEMDALIHGLRADGTMLRGVEVLRLAYEAVGLGALWQPTRWGPLRPLADAGYRVFARHRRTVSRVAAPLIAAIRAARAERTAARMRACASGQCDIRDIPRRHS